MRLSAMIGTWLLALSGAVDAHPIPMDFSVFYDGSRVGDAGTGALTFDVLTSQLTDLRFTFDAAIAALPNQALSFAGMQEPEPASLALIGLGVLGLALVCRKRRAK